MENIRNFCIISHIDHGKSTLADRFLELTGTVSKEKMRTQYLDMMDLEREKGITIKMQPVRMEYTLNNKVYSLNLIDTPGHVDFSYEVSRSLAATEGVILLVDATKGIQAQTLANLEMANKQNLAIIPVVNKIDLPQARVEETKKEIAGLLGVPENDIFAVSAKTGANVEQILEMVIEKIPSPSGSPEKNLRALIFDSKYDSFKGIIAYLRVIDGGIFAGDKIYLIQSESSGEVKEIGFFNPQLKPSKELRAGEIGYLATGIKESSKVRVGDTLIKVSSFLKTEQFRSGLGKIQTSRTDALPGYKEPKAVVFASIYPENPDDFDLLKESLAKLKLNDASFSFEMETKEALGRGFRCGFLGSLHAEIISERLSREFGLKLIISTPSVVFKIINQKNQEIQIYSVREFPEPGEIKESKEPWVKLEVITPSEYLGKILELLNNLEGRQTETKYFGSDKVFLTYETPLREIIVGFYDNLKGVSRGFASMNYEMMGYKPVELVKLEILIAGQKEEAFSRIVSSKEAFREGKKIVKKLKKLLPPQLFSVSLQAVVSGKIIARETISARRKDVTAPLYGGDYTRKRKLLEKQKKGKKKLKEKGRVEIPSRIFLEMFKG